MEKAQEIRQRRFQRHIKPISQSTINIHLGFIYKILTSYESIVSSIRAILVFDFFGGLNNSLFIWLNNRLFITK